MSTLIVPINFSDCAIKAMDYAFDFAKEFSFDIHLFHTITMVKVAETMGTSGIDPLPDLQEDATNKLMEIVRQKNVTHASVPCQYEVRVGSLIDELSDLTSSIKPIAIFMGISGHGNVVEQWIGSKTIEVMKQILYPVIVIPKEASFRPIRKICLACDLEEVIRSTPALSIRTLATVFNAKVDILNIDYQNRHFTPSTPDEMKALEIMLESTISDFHFLEDEHVEKGIDQFVRANDIDMVIVIPKKHPFLERLFTISHSTATAYLTEVPLLALHVIA